MFEQLAAGQVLRSTAVVTTTENVDFTVFDRRSGSIAVVITVASRTAGTITAQLVGSFDGGSSYPATFDTTGAISTNVYRYLDPAAPLPPNLRVILTPAGGFDGTVRVSLRSAGLVAGS